MFLKWFFDRYSPTTNIKAVGNADVTYGLAIDGDKLHVKNLLLKQLSQRYARVQKK